MVKSETQMVVDLVVLAIVILAVYYLKSGSLNIVDGVKAITGG